MKSITMRVVGLIFGLLIVMFQQSVAHAQGVLAECNSPYVVIEGPGYLVKPSGGDDTRAIQCAFDSAVKQSVPSIRLEKGDYEISSLTVTDFKGTFSGLSSKTTSLTVENYTFDCTIERARPIAFYVGDAILKNMSISVEDPCFEGYDFTALSFMQKSCDERTHFATVDRIVLSSSGPREGNSYGVVFVGTHDLIEREALLDLPNSTCELDGRGPTGKFTLNRSDINGFNVAVITSAWGASQVDISFNELSGGSGILVTNANQSTTIRDNKISFVQRDFLPDWYDPEERYVEAGVAILSQDLAWVPSRNRTVVHNNRIEQGALTSLENGDLVGIFIWDEAAVNHSLVVTDNIINTEDLTEIEALSWGLVLSNISNPLVNKNFFRGSGYIGALVTGTWQSPKKGAFTANTFPGAFETLIDVLVTCEVEGLIVAGTAFVLDLCENNYVLRDY